MKTNIIRYGPAAIPALLLFALLCNDAAKLNTSAYVPKGITGTWRLDYDEADIEMVFTSDSSFGQSMDGSLYLAGTYSTNDRVKPHELDITFTFCLKETGGECPSLNKVYACYIYKISGDTLTLAHACDDSTGTRPVDFGDTYDTDIAIRVQQ